MWDDDFAGYIADRSLSLFSDQNRRIISPLASVGRLRFLSRLESNREVHWHSERTCSILCVSLPPYVHGGFELDFGGGKVASKNLCFWRIKVNFASKVKGIG